MQLNFGLILCLLNIVVNAQIAFETCSVKGYYWREYTGEIPDDAFPGGKDANNKPIYIGQIYNVYIIPAKIYGSNKKVYYEYGGSEHEATENMKILCTQYPEQFEWIETNNDNIKLLTDKQLVIGGVEPGTTTYIGRARMKDEITIGKVLTDNFVIFSGLHITKDGSKERRSSFEVLSFRSKPYEIEERYTKIR